MVILSPAVARRTCCIRTVRVEEVYVVKRSVTLRSSVLAGGGFSFRYSAALICLVDVDFFSSSSRNKP